MKNGLTYERRRSAILMTILPGIFYDIITVKIIYFTIRQ